MTLSPSIIYIMIV